MRRPRQSRTSNLDLDAPGCLGNVDRLDTHLTIDNVRFAPCAYLVAQDIVVGTGAWASRHNASKILSVAGAGANPTYGNATAIENTAVKYAAAKYHAAADTTWGQLDTDDGAMECVFALGTVASQTILTTYAANTGISLTTDGSGNLLCSMRDGTGGLVTLQHNGLVAGAWYHVWAGIDRSEKAYLYVNGIAAATTPSASVTGIALTWTSAALILGSTAPQIACAALWDMAGTPWPGALKNATYMARIARERFAIVAGIQDRRQGAHTFTRATGAYLDKYSTRTGTTRWLHRVSAGWPRVCERIDTNGKRVTRFLGEPQITNLATNSEDLATTWTAENLTTISANGEVAPNTETTADGIVANATDTTHGIYGAYTLPATNHCLSLFAKVGNQPRIELYSTIANVSAYFNLLSGTVGTTGAAVTAAGIDPNTYFGYYRCWICFTGSADAKNYGMRASAADADNTFAGDTATVNTWVWGIQIEATAELFPSSYIPTAAAAVARNKDELSYNVRLPIVGNLNDLPQALTIGGTDYAPCAYLVADDVNVSTGAWASRHNATKALAYAGAGTNPTPQWDAVSRANNTVRYWASNTHAAADTTWGQIGNNDGVVEALFVSMDGSTISTRASGSLLGYGLLVSSGAISFIVGDGTDYVSATASPVHAVGTLVHFMAFIDKSDKVYFVVNGIYFGVSASTASVGDSTGGTLSFGALSGGVSATAGQLALFAAWNLPTNPLPGAATNEAVCTAIARARFDQLCQPTAMRLDCEILHPSVNRQAAANLVDAGVGANDRLTIGLAAADVLSSVGTANGSAQWSMAGSTDIAAGVSRKLSVKARLNSASANVDNASEATDAACEVPAGMTRVFVGELLDGTIQPTCLVGGVKLFRGDK